MNHILNSFLLQISELIKSNDFDDDDLRMIFLFTTSVDKSILIHYYYSSGIPPFDNDLDRYDELISDLLSIYDEREDYEKCGELKTQRNKLHKLKI